MILSDWQILERQQKINYTTPLITGFDKNNLNPASYDITLDAILLVERSKTQRIFNRIFNYVLDGSGIYEGSTTTATKAVKSFDSSNRFYKVDLNYIKDKTFWLKPGMFILGASSEVFNLPDDLTAEFKLKSSRAREGYGHQLAGWCDPGWHGSKLTLELFNPTSTALPLYPGIKIGQMVFATTTKVEKSYRFTGNYNNDPLVTESKKWDYSLDK